MNELNSWAEEVAERISETAVYIDSMRTYQMRVPASNKEEHERINAYCADLEKSLETIAQALRDAYVVE